ncbi:MAG TPA: transporter substrate-binding domain-containing protein [Candidatus Avilachnospira avistercoris]|nr:transporter substrate-binding domain-containing protein [Candidatus Avilachnospira avistercoris]
MKKDIMKYTAAALLAALALTACGGSAEETTAAATTAAAEAESEATAAPTEAETEADGGSRLDAILDAGVITMATSPDFAPYEFEDISSGTTEYAGADVELGRYIAEKLGVELQIEAMDFNACQGAVSMGAVDMSISGFAYTEERAENCGISDGYITSDVVEQGIIVLKDTAAELNSKEAFTGKTIAVQNASLQQQLRNEQLPDSTEEVVTNLNDAIMMLATGKVDGVASDLTVAQQYCDNYPDLQISDFRFEYETEGQRVLVPKGEDELLEAINEIIAEVNESGIYKEWLEESTELATSLGLEVN